jgi:beta-lactamase regulating signal transducer with metallopeptidase domain
MNLTTVPALIDSAAAHFVNALPQGLAIAAFAWIVLRVLPRKNAGTRFAVWFAALLGIAVMAIMPAFRPVESIMPAARPEITLPGSWAAIIIAMWAGIAGLALGRVALGLLQIRKLRRTCTPICKDQLDPSLREVVTGLERSRKLKVCTSPAIRVPAAIGFRHPLVAIPEWALNELSAEELKVVLLHEIEHIRRGDDWTNLIQKLVGALLFFHPAVWWIDKKLGLEREMACDEAVLAHTQNPHAYAECLVALAERSFLHRGVAMAMAAVGHVRDMSVRLAQILSTNRPAGTSVWKPALGLVGVFSLICVGVLPETPQLVGFTSPAQTFLAGTTDRLPSQQLVVPASVHFSNSGPVQRVKTHKPVKPAVQRRDQESPAIMASRMPRPTNRALVVPVKAQAHPMIAPRVVMVMQTTQYDFEGAPLWTVRVWQLTWTTANVKSVSAGAAAKSI